MLSHSHLPTPTFNQLFVYHINIPRQQFGFAPKQIRPLIDFHWEISIRKNPQKQ